MDVKVKGLILLFTSLILPLYVVCMYVCMLQNTHEHTYGVSINGVVQFDLVSPITVEIDDAASRVIFHGYSIDSVEISRQM